MGDIFLCLVIIYVLLLIINVLILICNSILRGDIVKGRILCKIVSVIMAVCLVVTIYPGSFAFADEPAAQSLDEQRDSLAKNLENVNKKLEELGEQKKDTKEYLDVLDEKIGYLNEQYTLAKDEAKNIEKKVTTLESKVEKNQSDIEDIKVELQNLQSEFALLNENFMSAYEVYCSRIRAIYVSGYQSSVLTLLLGSDSLTSMLTRYQMISTISKRDGELLQSVKSQADEVISAQNQLDEKNRELTLANRSMITNKASLENKKIELLSKQEDLQGKQATIESQQTEANKLLKNLNDKTKEYGEYRDITQEELDAIDAAIEAADKKYQTTTTKKTTTKTTTTTTVASNEADSTTNGNTTTTTTTTTTAQPASQYISLTYPCPAYTKITCGFGEYPGHTGCDFSTNKNENQTIVAAEDGIVILVKRLETSYGHYLVIRHDKTTSSGKIVYTLYAHNNDIIVAEGQHVSRGQQIAYSGTTGNSTGPHCHFEVRVGGSSQSYAVNPALYLP